MDFALDEQQLAFAASVGELLDDRFGTAAVRAVYNEPDGTGHPAKLWSTIGEQGWLAITVPEEFGGLGLGLVDAQIVARGLGARAIPGPWLTSTLAMEAIRLAGSDAQRAEWLPGLAEGRVVGTQVLGQDLYVGDAAASGHLVRVEYGAVADLLVVADDAGQIGVIDLAARGVRRGAQPQYDLGSRFATVDLDLAPVAVLAGSGPDMLRQLFDRAAVLTAADLVGIARESVTRTVAYDRQRVQFGRPVGSFQAIKHELADLHVAVTMAEQAVLYAAHALDAALPDAELAVSVAKSKASATAKDATAAMIQFTGGIAFTWEHDAHFYFKRAKRLAASFGDAPAHRERIVRLLLDAP